MVVCGGVEVGRTRELKCEKLQWKDCLTRD